MNSRFYISQLFLLVLALVLWSCSSQQAKESATLPQGINGIELTKNWSTYAGFGPSYRDYKWRLAQDEDKIYSLSKQGDIFTLNKESGSRKKIAQLGIELVSGITKKDNLLLVGTIEGELLAYNPESKETIWKAQLQSEILHPPVAGEGLVVVKTNNGKIWGVELHSGFISWSAVTNNPVLSTRTLSEPIFAGGVIISTFDTGKLTFLHPANGSRVWETAISTRTGRNEIQHIIDSDAKPVIDGYNMFVANLHGSLQKYEVRQAPTLKWSIPFSTHNDFLALEDNLYLVNESDHLIAINRSNGEKAWENREMEHRNLVAPVLFQNHIWVADNYGYLLAIDLEGNLAGYMELSPFAIEASIIHDDKALYLMDNGGYIHSVSIRPE